mgnify:CR=1 FL=1|jgi:hypothetical protein|tara:strand:- start:2314 stop:2511 length:198 start_codon:yes stop_codon:yes gene_type:complete
MTTEQLIIEGIARMDHQERESLVSNLADRYPNLAEDLLTTIGFELQARDEAELNQDQMGLPFTSA